MMKIYDWFKKKWNITSNIQMTIIFIVFAITGSACSYVGSVILDYLGIAKENMNAWTYYPFKILFVFFVYQVLLLLIGAIFGQFQFFYGFEKKMWRRMLRIK